MEALASVRERTREGVIEADCRSIMAEDFPAQPGSPRDVCLQAVRESDGLLLIIGTSYSAFTEEEYRAAREFDVPVFCLTENQEAEEGEQTRFRREVLDSI